jgi:hypothetical protein
LYEAVGFRRLRRLVGFERRAASSETPAVELREIDVMDVARAVNTDGLHDLPWQVSGWTLAQLAPPHVALSSGPSHVVITDPSAPVITIRALLTEKGARGRGHALALLRSLFARHPEKDVRVAATCPEELSGVLARAGLSPTSIAQWQMTRCLV